MIEQQSFLFREQPAPRVLPVRRNVVIEAGAGTGKTTAIVAEVLKLMLERDDLSPERIVLMTFTEKAAGEIADRIRVALEELASGEHDAWPVGSPNPLVRVGDSPRARRAIAHHLANIDALRSQTIHSFCQSLLRTFPIEAGLDPQFKIIEGFERSLLYGQLYDAWLDSETRVDPVAEVVAEWELLFTHAGYLFQIRDLILNLINRRDLLGESGDFGDFSLVETALTDAVLWIRRETASVKDPAANDVASYLRRTPFRGRSIDDWIAYLQPVAARMRDIHLTSCGVLKEAMRVLRSGDKGDSIYDRLTSHRAAMALLALTRRFLAYLDAEKRKLGVVDFDDLLLRTLALLDDVNVLQRARSQFDFIFVDEFQDTDRTQARIIDRLARDASGAFVPGRTIVVGDPKQSIYGFRRADPETYDHLTKALVHGGAEKRVIGEQYRSDPPLLETINAMFTRLFPEETHDPNVFRPAYRALRAARGESRRTLDARITLLRAQSDEKADRYVAEASSIAEWIAENRDGGERDLQRFAVLFRRTTKIDDYLDVFDRYGIDYVLPPTRLFLDRRAPVDLLAVLRAIAWPFDRGAQISAARTPYFALTDVEIADGGEAWNAFAEAMARFRDEARHGMISDLVDAIVRTSGIESVYDAMADGARHLRHLEHVRRIAFDYDTTQGGSVRQFVEEIGRRRSEPEEAEPTLADDSANAVRILTVHGAKGLEFETVILPDLAFPASMNDALQLFTVEEPKSLVLTGRAESLSASFRFAGGEPLKKIAGQRDKAELERLFYVAVTRAKTDVVFVCNPDEKRSIGFHQCLLEALGCEKKSFAAMWSEELRIVHETPVGPVAFEHRAVQTTGPRVRRRLRDEALEASLASAELAPCTPVTPEDPPPPLTAGEVAARRASARNRAAGILLHRVLELWDGRSSPDALVQQLALEAAADADALARVRRRLATIARSPTLARLARAETVGREVAVRVVEDGTLVERRIDRIVREDGRTLVVDYKSGAPDPARIEKDRAQVRRYCDAIAAIEGRECSGVIWYVGMSSDRLITA
ncbi:MAG TPA: UvrD-helicase domain-containing protein [Thermoanaerobaculia bacterium]